MRNRAEKQSERQSGETERRVRRRVRSRARGRAESEGLLGLVKLVYVHGMKMVYSLFWCSFCCGLLVACSGTELPDPFEAGWNGRKVCEIRSENDNFRLLECTFPPGVGHEKHEHAPHVGYTIVGSTFQITDDKGTRQVDVPDGSIFSKEANSIHEVLNVGTDTAIFLIYEYK